MYNTITNETIFTNINIDVLGILLSLPNTQIIILEKYHNKLSIIDSYSFKSNIITLPTVSYRALLNLFVYSIMMILFWDYITVKSK